MHLILICERLSLPVRRGRYNLYPIQWSFYPAKFLSSPSFTAVVSELANAKCCRWPLGTAYQLAFIPFQVEEKPNKHLWSWVRNGEGRQGGEWGAQREGGGCEEGKRVVPPQKFISQGSN